MKYMQELTDQNYKNTFNTDTSSHLLSASATLPISSYISTPTPTILSLIPLPPLRSTLKERK
jgi:hypothetical protein